MPHTVARLQLQGLTLFEENKRVSWNLEQSSPLDSRDEATVIILQIVHGEETLRQHQQMPSIRLGLFSSVQKAFGRSLVDKDGIPGIG